MTKPLVSASPELVLDRLTAILGAEGVLPGEASAPYWTDVYRALQQPIAVVRPASVAELQALVRACAQLGVPMYPRGGGASYTDGYLPNRTCSVVIDCGRLDRIVEINVEDAYVTVEAGVTWAALKAALDPIGLRTPFYGPFSGIAATVGGSVAQHSLSHGSGTHGLSAESVLCIEVVAASGEIVRTGSAGRGTAPFARFYGPDVTGLFTGDCGAFGVKARITLPLLARKAAYGSASFTFDTLEEMASAMRRAALERLDDEHFAIDAALAQGQIARNTSASALLEAVRGAFRTAPSKAAAVGQLARMAMAGTRALQASAYTVHYIIEGVSRLEVEAKLKRLRQVLAPGREIPNTVPTVVRGMPFAPLFNVLGPNGERWVPLHGVLPHSRVAAFHEALAATYAARAEEMRALGVWAGGMFETVGSTGFLYEIALYWPGATTAYHDAVLPSSFRAGLPIHRDDPAVGAFVESLKAELIELYERFDAVHFQIGKAYPFRAALEPPLADLLGSIKSELDPQGLMNPGALGF